jgi:hypothetical protein
MMHRTAVLFFGALFFCVPVVANGQSKPAKPRVVHVFVALADNEHQGIVPVPAALGNGDDPSRNLYWGAAFGVRTFFKNAPEWKEILFLKQPNKFILERSVFQDRTGGVWLVADAYRGSEIKQAVTDFFRAAAGIPAKEAASGGVISGVGFQVPPVADLVVYVGHDGLMDFPLNVDFSGGSGPSRLAIVLACASQSYFRDLLRSSGATPLLWTTDLMAPEAYTLKAAVEGWMQQESNEEIRKRAAAAYAKYQKCSDAAAMRLFSSDW